MLHLMLWMVVAASSPTTSYDRATNAVIVNIDQVRALHPGSQVIIRTAQDVTIVDSKVTGVRYDGRIQPRPVIVQESVLVGLARLLQQTVTYCNQSALAWYDRLTSIRRPLWSTPRPKPTRT